MTTHMLQHSTLISLIQQNHGSRPDCQPCIRCMWPCQRPGLGCPFPRGVLIDSARLASVSHVSWQESVPVTISFVRHWPPVSLLILLLNRPSVVKVVTESPPITFHYNSAAQNKRQIWGELPKRHWPFQWEMWPSFPDNETTIHFF